jgi:hypothetical protein
VLVALRVDADEPNPAADPYQILEKARVAWRQQVAPAADLHYRIAVKVEEAGKPLQEQYEAQSSSGGDVRVDAVSDAEAARAHVASGINVHLVFELYGVFIKKDVGKLEQSPDFLGVPRLSPTYAFGLFSRNVDDAAFPVASTSAGTNAMQTIATVVAKERTYDVKLAGLEVVGGFYAYHLTLQPRSDPKRYRLREIWIDAYDYAVLKAVTQGNFTRAPLTDVPWVITFQNVGGVTYIATEAAQAPLAFRRDRTYTHVTIAFELDASTSSPPVLPPLSEGLELREP